MAMTRSTLDTLLDLNRDYMAHRDGRWLAVSAHVTRA
jgi:hypothetical protein